MKEMSKMKEMEMETGNDNYIFSTTNVSEQYSSNMPIDDIVKLGDKIWNEIKYDQDIDNESKQDDLFQKYFSLHPDFSRAFPLVLRWMVYLHKYSSKSFKKFLLKYSTTKISTKKEFITLQAEYLIFLYKESGHYSPKQISDYRSFIIKQLLDEEDLHVKMEQEAKEEIEKMEFEKRKLLYEYIKTINNKP